MFQEKGGEKVDGILDGSYISAVNVAEVFSKLAEKQLLTKARVSDFYKLSLKIESFDRDQALIAGELRNQTRSLGLSFGDRCCIALAIVRDATAMTADREWKKLKVCRIESIR